MSASENPSRLPALTLALYWSAILGGFTIPGLVSIGHEIAVRHARLADAWQDFHLYLFAPGYNLFLVAALNAIPFVLLAVFLLLHLGTALPHGHLIVSRRIAGVLGAWLTAFGLSLWMHLSLTLHPDAQGAIGLFFLPIYALVLMPVGYGAGRLAGRFALR